MVLDCSRIEQHTSLLYRAHFISTEEENIQGTQFECRYTQSQKPATTELWTGKKS